MDKKELSKQKYIYHVYTSCGEVHVERHTIIYSNVEYVYFKKNGTSLLAYTSINYVRDTIVNVDSYTSIYTFKEPDKDLLKEEYDIFIRKQLTINTEKQIAILEAKKEKIETELEKLKNRIKL